MSHALESFQINGFVVLDNTLSKLQLEDLRKAPGFSVLGVDLEVGRRTMQVASAAKS